MRAISALSEVAQRGPPRPAQSHADDWVQRRSGGGRHGHGVFPLAMSEVTVEGMNLLAGSARTVVFLSSTQIAGYIPGTRAEPLTGGAWSVAFSYGPCESLRRDGISRMLARVQTRHEGGCDLCGASRGSRGVL